MNALEIIEIFAGIGPDSKPVSEKIQVIPLGKDQYKLVKSPAFVKGLASGDTIKFDAQDQYFEILKHSGNLCIRIISKNNIETIVNNLGPELEKLGGELDIHNPRVLVYSIHVSCGFNEIEQLLNKHTTKEDFWLYGNVYDPSDGVTPLNWWNDILKPE